MKIQHKRPNCCGCGIPLSDGYSLGCQNCWDRRSRRLAKGEIFTPTGFGGEAIDNRYPKGRLVCA